MVQVPNSLVTVARVNCSSLFWQPSLELRLSIAPIWNLKVTKEIENNSVLSFSFSFEKSVSYVLKPRDSFKKSTSGVSGCRQRSNGSITTEIQAILVSYLTQGRKTA